MQGVRAKNRVESQPPVTLPPVSVEISEPSEKVRIWSLSLLTVILVGLCIWIALPFLPAIAWAIALAIIAWPFHRQVRRVITTPKLAAALSTASVMVLIVGAGLFVTYHLAREAASVTVSLQKPEVPQSLRVRMNRLPFVEPALSWMDRVGVDVEAEVRKIATGYTQDAAKLAQGSVSIVIQLLVTSFLLFHLLLDSSDFRQGIRNLMPLSRDECNQVMSRAAESVHASVYANFLTSLIDAVGGGLMLWWLGVSQPVLWSTVMFVLSLLPVVGAGLVWVPIAIYFLFSGQWVSFLLLTLWGVGTFVIVDNFLYFRLIGTRMRLHQALTLIALLGGVAVFGISGMILGPAILALTVAFLEVWRHRLGSRSESPLTTGLTGSSHCATAGSAS